MSASERLRVLDGAATPVPWWSDNPSNIPEGWILHSPDGESRGVDGQIIATLRNALPLIADVVEAAEGTWCCTDHRENRVCSRGGIGCGLPHHEDSPLTALREHLEGQ